MFYNRLNALTIITDEQNRNIMKMATNNSINNKYVSCCIFYDLRAFRLKKKIQMLVLCKLVVNIVCV